MIAATLLDLKAARLLPAGEVHDEEDLALLEVRDLLFARLLQYRAFKHVAVMFAELEAAALRSYPRAVSLEDQLRRPAARGHAGCRRRQLRPDRGDGVHPAAGADGRHRATCTCQAVSVPEQAGRLLGMLEARGIGQWASFSELVADCGATIEIVGRFLALLELFRARAVAFDQSEPLGVLQVSWTGDRPDQRVPGAGGGRVRRMTDDMTDRRTRLDATARATPATRSGSDLGIDVADHRSWTTPNSARCWRRCCWWWTRR